MIGSQALIAEPRATVPSPTARGPCRRQAVRRADDVRPTTVVAPTGADRRLRRREAQAIDELGLLVGSQEQVDRGVTPPEARPVRLADRAPGEHDPHSRVRRLQPGEVALPADDLLLRALPDRAGVDDHEVRRVDRRRLGATGREQAPGHLLRVAAVHLAAERPDVEARQGLRLRHVLGQPRVGRRLGERGPPPRPTTPGGASRARAGIVGVRSSVTPPHRTPGALVPDPRQDRLTDLRGHPELGVRLGVGPRSPW